MIIIIISSSNEDNILIIIINSILLAWFLSISSQTFQPSSSTTQPPVTRPPTPPLLGPQAMGRCPGSTAGNIENIEILKYYNELNHYLSFNWIILEHNLFYTTLLHGLLMFFTSPLLINEFVKSFIFQFLSDFDGTNFGRSQVEWGSNDMSQPGY